MDKYTTMTKSISLSDGYFILEEYFEGTDFWKKLDGEYAIIILDSIKNRVIFATDVFGTKPLFYSLEDNVFPFLL